MGLDINSVQLCIAAKKRGASFRQVLTLGRLSLNVYPATMVQVLRAHGLPHERFQRDPEACTTAEPFFQTLGAERVDSLDASAFEGATLVHDLNLPAPESFQQRYDVVFDGGTIEHVFHVTQAIKTCMELVKVGGRLFIHNCANNLCGHGFYQFSPELFYRAFSTENGFEVERMILHRVGPYGRWYEVFDPARIGQRTELITFTPIHLLAQAKRVAAKPIFAAAPQQSDYTVMWKEEESQDQGAQAQPPPPAATLVAPRLSRVLPGLARLLHVIRLGLLYYYTHSFRNRRLFRPVRRDGR